MHILTKELQNLSLKDCIDITDEIFSSLTNIKDGKVVLYPDYGLLEGTRAVEVDNQRLDTTMIGLGLDESEINFDVNASQSPEAILAIMDQLICLTMSWLNNSSLRTTVLSCRYVQSLLENYNKQPLSQRSLDACQILDVRIAQKNAQTLSEATLDYNVHTLLRAYIIGLLKFIDLCLIVCTEFLYEEEDYTSGSFELTILREVHQNEVNQLLDKVLNDFKNGEDAINKEIGNRIKLIRQLNDISELLNTRIDIFNPNKPKLDTSSLSKSLELINDIGNLDTYKDKIPKGTFSRFIQQDLSNSSIPAELYCMDPQDCLNSLRYTISDIEELVLKSQQISNIFQLDCFLEYEVAQKASSFNVLVRAFYSSFFLHDNVHIFRSSTTISEVMFLYMNDFCCRDSVLFQQESWSVNSQTKESILMKFDKLFQDFQNIIFQKLIRPTNNPCRQRQLINKCLLIWDTLQVTSEDFEIDLWTNYKIGDTINNNEPGLPISSYVYFNKLQEMIGMSLKGFELNLYKPFEFCQMYWYISYLSELVIEHLKTRVHLQISSRIQYINQGLSKKIKKLKAGDKKQQLKLLQKLKQERDLPLLQQSERFNGSYLTVYFEALLKLTNGIKYFFVVLNYSGILDIFKGPKHNITPMESIYNLRMKPFSSIGVPNLPTFSQYQNAIQLKEVTDEKLIQLLKISEGELKKAHELYIQLGEFVKENSIYFIGENIRNWLKQLQKVCENYTEVNNILKGIVQDKLSNKFKFTIIPNDTKQRNLESWHKYFPKVQLIEIESRK